jgi:hypothetical protein
MSILYVYIHIYRYRRDGFCRNGKVAARQRDRRRASQPCVRAPENRCTHRPRPGRPIQAVSKYVGRDGNQDAMTTGPPFSSARRYAGRASIFSL